MLSQDAVKRYEALYASSMRDAKRRFDLELGDVDNALVAQGPDRVARRIEFLQAATQKLLATQAAAAWRDLRELAAASPDGTFDGLAAQLKQLLVATKIDALYRQLENLLAGQAAATGKLAAAYQELARKYGAAIEQYVAERQRGIRTPAAADGGAATAAGETGPPYVAPERIAELRACPRTRWDLGRLAQLCVELNVAHGGRCTMATALLLRAILDHVPPIFGMASFDEVAQRYDAGGTTFKKQMHRLQHLTRRVADGHLNRPIQAAEILPSPADVDFRSPLGELLGEIVRVVSAAPLPAR